MALILRRNKALQPVCPLTECMSFLGSAWTPNVIWSLSAQPCRFAELRHDIPRITAKVLSTRLHQLESMGVISRKVMPTSPPSVEYALTPLGLELVPAIDAIVKVSHKLKRKACGRPRRGLSKV